MKLTPKGKEAIRKFFLQGSDAEIVNSSLWIPVYCYINHSEVIYISFQICI